MTEVRRFEVGRDSIDSITNRYGLDGPGLEYQWGWDFARPYRPAIGYNHPPLQEITGLFLGGKRPKRGVQHPLPSGTEVKETSTFPLDLYGLFQAELYL